MIIVRIHVEGHRPRRIPDRPVQNGEPPRRDGVGEPSSRSFGQRGIRLDSHDPEALPQIVRGGVTIIHAKVDN